MKTAEPLSPDFRTVSSPPRPGSVETDALVLWIAPEPQNRARASDPPGNRVGARAALARPDPPPSHREPRAMDRTVAAILARWREALTRLDADPSDATLQDLVASLRGEYQEAVHARAVEADELRDDDRPKDPSARAGFAWTVL